MADSLGIFGQTYWTEDENNKQRQLGVSGNKMLDGGALPELYGTLRITPPRIAEYVESNYIQQTQNTLYAISKWGIDSVSDFRINGDDLADFPEIPTPDVRYGGNVQEVIQAFQDLKSDTPVDEDLTTSFNTISSLNSNNTGFGIGLYFPEGLYKRVNNEYNSDATVYITCQYQVHGSGSWVTLWQTGGVPTAATTAHWSGGYWGTNPIDGAAIWREIEVGSTTPGDHVEADQYTPDPSLWALAGNTGQDYKLHVCIWHWVAVSDVIVPTGTPESTAYITITQAQSEAFRVAYFKTALAAGQYDIRVKLYQDINVDDATYVYHDRVVFEFYREIIEDGFTLPNVSLVSLSAVPTEKLSGGISTVDFIANRLTVYVHNPTTSTWVTKPANNPAWICYDLIHRARYLQDSNTLAYGIHVMGEPADRMDKYWTWWLAWAAWCDWDGTAPYTDKKPYTCNIYLDSIMSLQDRLDVVGRCGRGVVRQVGRYFKPVFESPEIDITQRFLFSPANISRDSFSETFSAATGRANVAEITFQDPDNFYETDTVRIADADYDASGAQIQTVSMSLVGCCDRYQAATFGKYLLNRNRYLTATSTWLALWDSIRCEPGDIVEVRAEFGGRLLAGCTTTSLKLDSEVVLLPGVTYKIVINHQATDVREESTITTAAGTVSTVTVSPALGTAPAIDCKWALGESGQQVRVRRVISIARESDLTARITGEEFNSAVFGDDVDIPATPFNPFRWRVIPPALDSVSISIEWVLDASIKTFIPHVRVTFVPDSAFDYKQLSIPITGIRVWGHAQIGNTVGSPMEVADYGLVFDVAAAYLDAPAASFNGQTFYVTAAFVNQQGMVGPKCAQTVSYIDTSFTPVPTTNSISIDSYDYEAAGKENYIVYFSWLPSGWVLDGGKYKPVLSWNSGSNYYVFAQYGVIWGFVDAPGAYPTLDTMHYFMTPDIGNIFAPDGSIITDATDLDEIARGAASGALTLPYGKKYVRIAAVPLTKNGIAAGIDTTQADFGLDWDTAYALIPGGPSGAVDNPLNLITNAELLYSQQAGSTYLCELQWDYPTNISIDGFAIFARIQPYQWSWQLDASVASSVVTLAGIVSQVDFITGGGEAANIDFTARYATWIGGSPWFYMMFSDNSNYEISGVSTDAGYAVERGMEGTTARTWATGAWFSYFPCAEVDDWVAVPNITQRNHVFSPPIELNNAIHSSICAVKLCQESPGYKRSYYAAWTDAVEVI